MDNFTSQIAKHFRDVHFGGNWTDVNLKDSLQGIDWELATRKLHSLNTIALLVYHVNYYVSEVMKVLKGNPLEASDKFSFAMPTINSQQEWENLLAKTWSDAEEFAKLIEEFPENRLCETFIDKKYGNYQRNFLGIIEHTHYHLGQIVLVKKMLLQANEN